MKKIYCTLLFVFITVSGLFAQVNFEKGHFISENGQRTECYIRNEGWNNTPSKFNYKLTLDGDVKVLRIENLKSVVIDDAFKFEKHTVKLDVSPRKIEKLSLDRNPEFVEKTLLLNVLIEGKATLYSFIDTDVSAFFFKKDNSKIEPLIYKVFTTEDRKILYNSRYRQQLSTEFPCETISDKTILKVDYNAGDLTSFFLKYNACKGEVSTQFRKVKKGVFHGRIFAGMNNSSTKNELGLATFFRSNLNTESAWSPTFGVELEYVFPFNKNAWSMFIAPNYTSYKGEGKFLDLLVERRFEIEYSAIQIPIGFRHSIFLNDDSKVFLSAAALIDISMTTKTDGNFTLPEESFKTSAGVAFGIGYSYDKYSIEVRYAPNRELVEKSAQTSIKLTQLGITLGYSIF